MVILYSIIVILNILDVIFTKIIILSPLEEANPIMRYVMFEFGVLGGALMVKVFWLIILGILIYYVNGSKLLFRGMIFLVIAYTILTVYHILILTLD